MNGCGKFESDGSGGSDKIRPCTTQLGTLHQTSTPKKQKNAQQ